MRKKIYKQSDLIKQLKKYKKKGQTVVTTNGVFDIIHLGHIEYLEKAKNLGDVLVVALNSDASVRNLKGPTRPLNPLHARMKVIAALECVDYVTWFGGADPRSLLKKIAPHFHVKGGDYIIDELIEKEAVEEEGGVIVVFPMKKGYSTTTLMKKICETGHHKTKGRTTK